MNNYITIPAGAVMSEGRLGNGTNYIVYVDGSGEVNVCAAYTRKGNSITICTRYVRRLCGSAYEFEKLGEAAVKGTAYGAYMDGAAQGR